MNTGVAELFFCSSDATRFIPIGIISSKRVQTRRLEVERLSSVDDTGSSRRWTTLVAVIERLSLVAVVERPQLVAIVVGHH